MVSAARVHNLLRKIAALRARTLQCNRCALRSVLLRSTLNIAARHAAILHLQLRYAKRAAGKHKK
jgi:hypothetical protein